MTIGRINEEFHIDILKKPIERPDKSFKPLSSFIGATESSIQFSTVLPVGRSPIASSCQPIRSTTTNCNCNDITNITKIARVENPELVDGSTIAEGVISSGG
jgi:hypothetical protein